MVTVGVEGEEISCSLEDSHGDKVVLIGFKSHADVLEKATEKFERSLQVPVEARLVANEHPEELSKILDEILRSEAPQFDEVVLTATAGEMSLTEKAVAEAIVRKIRVVI